MMYQTEVEDFELSYDKLILQILIIYERHSVKIIWFFLYVKHRYIDDIWDTLVKNWLSEISLDELKYIYIYISFSLVSKDLK